MNTEIGIVIVTFNRKNDLQKALKCYEKQSVQPKYVIVIDNNSSDGTDEILKEWDNAKTNFNKYIISLEENIGGSGGFYTGLEKAMNLDADWIWVADDDAFPEYDALEKATNFIKNEPNIDNISSVCGSVINNGKIDLNHRRKLKRNLWTVEQVPVEKELYNNQYFDLELFSYVGTIINKKQMEKVGLPEKDYFIYYDDTEHSLRLSNVGRIVCVPKIKINHNVPIEENNINWKSYYSIRNKLSFIKKHFPSRYYLYLKNKLNVGIIARAILKRDKVYIELIKAAVRDEGNNVMGLSGVYKPGWKYTKG